MDVRGGTITWFLTANDADFDKTTERVRRNAKQTGDDVDREFKRGFGGAKISLDDFRKNLDRSAQLFRDFQVALRGFELTSMIIGATIATGAIIELVGAVTALGGLVLTVPAGIATFAGAFGALGIATSGVADAFKDATKETRGMSSSQTAARRTAELMKNSMRQQAALTRRMTDLNQEYSETLKELAEERMRKLNEQIQKGVNAWKEITDAASDFLDVANRMDDIAADVAQAQLDLNSAIITYGASSVQAREATQNLFAQQAKLASSNAQLDSQYSTIKDSVKDLTTNLNSLRKANRNEMSASLLNLKAMRLEKQSRGENIDEITNMISLLEGLIDIKDTKLTTNVDTAGAQAQLDSLRQTFPGIAIAAKEGATATEQSLTKSLANIKDSMADVSRQRLELDQDLKDSLASIAEQATASGAIDPFRNLSANARRFVEELIRLKDAFDPIRRQIQDKLFAGLDVEIRNLAQVFFPIAQEGFGAIATAMNGMAKEASRVAQQPFFTGAVSASLQNTANATSILTQAIEPLARIVTDLVNVGNPYIIMLSNWIVRQAELTAAFTSSEEGQRKMTDAINLGITALQSIGSLLGAVGGLFLDLFKISNEAGISFIGTLTEMINRIRDWLGTADGQAKMTALFEATDTIFRALLETLGQVVLGILAIVEAYNNLDGPMKSLVTNILVFAAAATPVLTYVSSLFASLRLVGLGVVEAFQALNVVAGGKLSGALGGIAKDGKILSNIFGIISKHPIIAALTILAGVFVYLGTQTTVFQDAFKQLQPVFEQTWQALQPLFEVLGQLAGVLGGAIATIVPVIAEVFGQLLVAVLPLIPPILQLVMTLLPVLVTILQVVVGVIQFLLPILTVVAQIIGTVLVIAVNVLVGVLKFLVSIVQGVADAFVAAWNFIVGVWNGAGAFFAGVWQGIVTIFSAVVNFYRNVFTTAWNIVRNVWNVVVGFFRGVWNGIMGIFSAVGSWFGNVFRGAVGAVQGAWNGVVGFFRGIWNGIVNAFSGVANLGRNIVEGLWNGISNMGNWIASKIRGFGEGVLNGIKSFFGIKSPSRVMRDQVGKMLGLGIAGGITESTAAAVRAAQVASDRISAGFSVGQMATDFSVSAEAAMTPAFAPAVVSATDSTDGISNGVTINQTNEVYTELDMDQVNRNLTWELNKL